MPTPIMGRKASILIFMAMLIAANGTVPKRPMNRMKTVNPIMSMKNWSPLGSPNRTRRLNKAWSKRHPEMVRYWVLFARFESNAR